VIPASRDSKGRTARLEIDIPRDVPLIIVVMTSDVASDEVSALLLSTYKAFNARDTNRVLAAMHPDVDWANGMDGGFVHGRDAVRDYWIRQWQQIDPHVDPQRFTSDDAGRIVADVHQVVRDLAGRVLNYQMAQHVYVIEAQLIRRMEIRRMI